MSKLDFRDIESLLRNSGIDNDAFNIKFDMIPLTSANVYEEEGTRLVSIRANVTAIDKRSKSKVVFPTDLLKYPISDEAGYKIKGRNKQMVSGYTISYGWYVNKSTGSFKMPHLELKGERGPKLIIYSDNYILRITSGKNKNNSVPLAIFLKAVTGQSFAELLERIGNENMHITRSFMEDEPTRSSCIEMVVKTMFKQYTDAKKDPQLRALSGNDMFQIIHTRLFSGAFLYLGNTSGVRLRRATSFKERCNNTYLAETIKVYDRVFEKNMPLDGRVLDLLDYLPLDKLNIFDTDGKYFTVRKDSAYTFRALDCTLREDTKVKDRIFEKGTHLDLATLREIEQSDLENLAVVTPEGESKVFSRLVYRGSLRVEDVISMTQVFTDGLNGLDSSHNIYSLDNQNLDTLDLRAQSLIKENCEAIVQYIMESTLNSDVSDDLMSKVTRIPRLSLDTLIERVASTETKESQQAELNNTLQKESKEYKISKDVARSTQEMTNIQPSQFSRIDQIDSPESSKIGIVQSLTYFAKVDDFGFITAPFIPVSNGVVTGTDPVYLSVDEQSGQYVASWDETFVDKNGNLKNEILALSDTTLLKVPLAEVKYKQVGPYDTMSLARMQSPFQEHSNQKRILMATNQSKQSMSVIRNERALVQSGGESMLKEGIIEASTVLSDLYDSLEKGTTNLTKEEFLKCRLKLVSQKMNRGSKTLFLEVIETGNIVKFDVPFMLKANSGAMFTYLINTRTGLIYKGDDVISHAMDIDIRKYDLNKHINLGHMKVDEKVFERSWATARNLIVGYKTHESSMIDDAVLLSEEVVGKHYATSIELNIISYELNPEKFSASSGVSETESFNTYHPETGTVLVGGIPKVGDILNPGDVVISVKADKSVIAKGQPTRFLPSRIINTYIESGEEGQVVFSTIEGNKAIVMIALFHPISTGDKVAGRHGNKGVIAKIIPEHEMPFDDETGLRLQICLNPQGVPSRSAVSQLLEVLLGMASRKLGQVSIVSPYVGDTLEFVNEMADKANVKPMRLRDGRTGNLFDREINVGVIYMWILEHKSGGKMKGTGISGPVDPVFNQPSKGKGGQAFGEYESWVLGATQSRRLAQDLFSLHSDDLMSLNTFKNSLTEVIDNIDIMGENNNDNIFQVITRPLCVEPVTDDNGDVWFKPLTDRMIRSLNPIPIDIHNKDSLNSANIFGATTNNTAKYLNRTTWSWMPLHVDIIHPFYVVKGKLHSHFLVSSYMLNTKGETVAARGVMKQDQVKDLIAGRIDVAYPKDGTAEYIVYDRRAKAKIPDDYIISTGMEAMVYMARNPNTDKVKEFLMDRYQSTTVDANKWKCVRDLRSLTDFEDSGSKVEDFIISSLPVIPLTFRPTSKFEHIVQDFTYYYKRIMDEVVRYKSLSVKTNDAVYSIYMRIVEFTGLTYGKEPVIEKQYKPLMKYFTGRENQDSKHGRVRESMIKKPLHLSGRAVIVPSSDTSRPMDYIGIPFKLVLKSFEPFLINVLADAFSKSNIEKLADQSSWKKLLKVMATNRVNFDSLAESMGVYKEYPSGIVYDSNSFYDKAFSVIKAFIEGYKNPDGTVVVEAQVVVSGRQPSLHKFSMRGYRPIIVMHDCIEIHPLLCAGYNADFDGDQMYFYIVVNEDAKREALNNLSAKSGVINPKDGSVIISHTQDIRLGTYYATMLHENVESLAEHPKYKDCDIRFYNNINSLMFDLENKFISVHDLITFAHKGSRYISTAGRIVFNSFIPDGQGFTKEEFKNILDIPNIKKDQYCDLMFDGLISGKPGKSKKIKYCSLPKITMWTYENFDTESNMDFYQKVSEFGFKFSDASGISLFLSDFVQDPRTEEMVDKAKAQEERIARMHYLGALSDKEKNEEVISLYQSCSEVIKDGFIKSFDRNNNIFLMFDSGARGSEDQIMQASGIIGVLQKSKDEVLETPILTNYTKGLSCFDVLQSSYSTRLGVHTTQNETAVSGELTRKAVYQASGFKIVEDKCSDDVEEFKIKYAVPSGRLLHPTQEETTLEALLGKKLVEGSEAYLHAKNFLGPDNTVTDKAISMLTKGIVQYVECEDTTYQIHYKPDILMASMLQFRQVEEDIPGVLHRDSKMYISDKTLAWIATKNPTSIKVRTMLSCKSIGGVCAQCYGLKYDTKRLPNVGDYMGYESAQSIGEPSSQMTLSLFHKGGAANESIDKGVEIYKSIIATGFPLKYLPKATLATREGYFFSTRDKYKAHLMCKDAHGNYSTPVIIVSPTPFTLDDGTYVTERSLLTEGYAMPSELDINPTLESIRFKQMCLLQIHHMIFHMNKISVNARHFEVFVRLQTSLVDIFESDSDKFLSGRTYELSEVLYREDQDSHVVFSHTPKSTNKIMEHYSGLVTSLIYEDFAGGLGGMVASAQKSKGSSMLGNLAVGRNIKTNEPKAFVTPKELDYVDQVSTTVTSSITESLLLDDIVEEVKTINEVAEEINWAELLTGVESSKPEKVADKTHIQVEPMKLDLEDEPVQHEDVQKEEVSETSIETLKGMGVFGTK